MRARVWPRFWFPCPAESPLTGGRWAARRLGSDRAIRDRESHEPRTKLASGLQGAVMLALSAIDPGLLRIIDPPTLFPPLVMR